MSPVCRYDVLVDGNQYGVDFFDGDNEENRIIAAQMLKNAITGDGLSFDEAKPAPFPPNDETYTYTVAEANV